MSFQIGWRLAATTILKPFVPVLLSYKKHFAAIAGLRRSERLWAGSNPATLLKFVCKGVGVGL